MSRGHRQSTTPMDFEWTNQHGPVDQQSPFITATRKREDVRLRRGQQWLTPKPGPHSVLDSPSRNAFATPSRPHAHNPDPRPFVFDHSHVKPLPSIPSHVQSAWEPRTPAHAVDFSSGGETPNTPAVDSDQPTPDTQPAGSMVRLPNADGSSPTKPGRRESWFRRAFLHSPSPSKDPHRHYAENRVTKRPPRERRKAALRVHDDADDSDAEQPSTVQHTASTAPGTAPPTLAMSLGGFLSWVEAHPQLPSVLSFYMQLAVNTFLGCLFIYVIYSAWRGVLTDVDIESSKHLSQAMVQIALCTKKYTENRCSPADRVPHMETLCGAWQTCMDRDPRKVARASVTAKTFATIFNSFTDEFSYKSMLFTALVIFGGCNFSNWAFGIVRSQQAQAQMQMQQRQVHVQQRGREEVYAEPAHRHRAFLDDAHNWQHTPGAARQDPPARPLLLEHAQSMPAVPGVMGVETGRKRGFL